MLSPTGNADVFLAKYDAATGNYLSAVKLGGAGFDTASPGGMRIDSNDNIYLTGNKTSSAGCENISVFCYSSDKKFNWCPFLSAISQIKPFNEVEGLARAPFNSKFK